MFKMSILHGDPGLNSLGGTKLLLINEKDIDYHFSEYRFFI